MIAGYAYKYLSDLGIVIILNVKKHIIKQLSILTNAVMLNNTDLSSLIKRETLILGKCEKFIVRNENNKEIM